VLTGPLRIRCRRRCRIVLTSLATRSRWGRSHRVNCASISANLVRLHNQVMIRPDRVQHFDGGPHQRCPLQPAHKDFGRDLPHREYRCCDPRFSHQRHVREIFTESILALRVGLGDRRCDSLPTACLFAPPTAVFRSSGRDDPRLLPNQLPLASWTVGCRFEWDTPDERGVEVKLKDAECCSEFRDDYRVGSEIDVRKLPADLTHIRFYNSY
jgi:hypothetical protein